MMLVGGDIIWDCMDGFGVEYWVYLLSMGNYDVMIGVYFSSLGWMTNDG